jgi:hypothetical protein
MKIIKYATATANDFKSLDAIVAEFISQGFQPYGNPYSSRDTSQGRGLLEIQRGIFAVSQAMVKYEDSK